MVVVPLHGKNQSWVEYSSLRTLPVLPMPAWVLQQPPKDMLVRLTVDFKLPIVMNVIVNGYLSIGSW